MGKGARWDGGRRVRMNVRKKCLRLLNADALERLIEMTWRTQMTVH
jgi:hypothetical protein